MSRPYDFATMGIDSYMMQRHQAEIRANGESGASSLPDAAPEAQTASAPGPDVTMRGILAPGRRLAYALAGRATITVRSAKTGTRFTYKITRCADDKKALWFVALLSGPDNVADYQYLGIVKPVASDYVPGFTRHFEFRLTAKSRAGADAPSVVAMMWLAKNWESDRVEVWHEGSCGRCDRKLTVPESIESGIGPTCAGR